MAKKKKNGKIGILYSPGFGAGWSTWVMEWKCKEFMIFDRKLIDAVEKHDLELLQRIMAENYPDAYLGGMSNLRVMYLDPGTVFKINEYDGHESISIAGSDEFFTA